MTKPPSGYTGKKSVNNRYVYIHRFVMEQMLGRILVQGEVVHHKNGNKEDNRPKNLELMTNSEHSTMHGTKGRTFIKLRCPECQVEFEKERNKTHLVKGGNHTSCSRTCSGKFQHRSRKDKKSRLTNHYLGSISVVVTTPSCHDGIPGSSPG